MPSFNAFVVFLQQWLHETLAIPVLMALGQADLIEAAYDALEWVVLGLVEVVVLAVVLGLLERRFPAEPVVDRDAIRTDIGYTLLHRLGLFPLLAFAVITPLVDEVEGAMRLLGWSRLDLEPLWPGVTDVPWVAFLVYLVALDFVDYWIHRGQHAWSRWWALHAVHHSQRQMTFWSDQRNHVLDDLVRDAILAFTAIGIGAAPEQFIGFVIAGRVLQQVQHANLAVPVRPGPVGWFAAIVRRLVVTPAFHRRHHAIGLGHEGRFRGCNFGVILPWWDMAFRSADWRPGTEPTGIRDQLEGRDYGRGFWAQHALATARMLGLERRGRA